MKKPNSAKQLAEDILERSTCAVQVGAVIMDRQGRIVSWGWNSPGNGYGFCAEEHAVVRANTKRLRGATIYVAGERKRNRRFVLSKPCERCQQILNAFDLRAFWRDKNGEWND